MKVLPMNFRCSAGVLARPGRSEKKVADGWKRKREFKGTPPPMPRLPPANKALKLRPH